MAEAAGGAKRLVHMHEYIMSKDWSYQETATFSRRDSAGALSACLYIFTQLAKMSFDKNPRSHSCRFFFLIFYLLVSFFLPCFFSFLFLAVPFLYMPLFVLFFFVLFASFS